MAAPADKTIELRLPSELGKEKLAIALVESVAARMGFSPDRVQDLKTAVGEACINAIEHGNQCDSRMLVYIQLAIEPTQLSIRVVDQGKEPIPFTRPRPSIQRMVDGEAPSGGFGIFLIQNLMDEVEICREPGGKNQLRMVLHLNEEQTADKRSDA